MKTISHRTDWVRFYTFNESNQGSTYRLGDHLVEIRIVQSVRTRAPGCTSMELFEDEMEIVTLEGRSFILEKTSFLQPGDPLHSVALPYGFRPREIFPKKCPYCGK